MYFNKAASIFQAIERIAATAGKNDKETLIKSVGGLPLFMRTVRAAYDPFTNYGIAIAPKKRAGLAPGANTLDEEQFWELLSKLASRALSGTAAREAVQNAVDLLDDSSSELFRRIIGRDLRAGFTDGTINRVFPGTIAEFPYMRCSLQAKSNMAKWGADIWAAGVISQEKADGMFANVNRGIDGVEIRSRQGSQFPAGGLRELEISLLGLPPDTQSHGELVVELQQPDGTWKVAAREIGNGILNSVLSGGQLEPCQRVVYMAWDNIPLSAVKPKGKYEVGYRQRLLGLIAHARNQITGDSLLRIIPTRVVHSMAEAVAHYKVLLAQGKEGTVVKSPDAIWKDGTSKDQVKFKLEVDVELKIVGFVPGTPGTKTEATFGSLLCESECGKLQVAVSGITDAQRLTIHNDRERFLQKVMTTRANSVMAPSIEDGLYSLFLPRSIEIREDKLVADTLEQIQDQFAAAVSA